ncbi:MAG TPA: glycosyltransferase family 4 protein [Thermoleophilaceae bacterium]|nr:glycosyltransferase family 4 protein [Thermoleophilaceae bacterium]
MRVAVIETAARGGLLHYAAQLADALAGRGHTVDLIAPAGNELAARAGKARMRPVLSAGRHDEPEPRSRPEYLRRRVGIAAGLARSWAQILRLCSKRRYDAVVLNCEVSLTPVAVALLVLTWRPWRPRLTFVCHNVRPFNRWSGDQLFRSSRLLDGALRRAFGRLDVIFVHGERSRDEFERLWPSRQLTVVPHGDETLFADDPPPPSDEPRVLFFGDWRKVKGLEVLMSAFDLLAETDPEVALTIAGTPSPVDLDPDVVHAWARRHDGRVRIVDSYVPIEEVPAIFGSARVVATPYLVGYQSGVVHLAMTMARAVVASDVGDLPSAVADGETGRVVASDDPPALAEALRSLLADPELAARMGAAGHRRVLERSGWDQVAQRVEDALAGKSASGTTTLA